MAQWLGRRCFGGECPRPMPDLWLTRDHTVVKLSAMGQTTRTKLSLHQSEVGKCVVISVFTWITEVKTMRRQTMATHGMTAGKRP